MNYREIQTTRSNNAIKSSRRILLSISIFFITNLLFFINVNTRSEITREILSADLINLTVNKLRNEKPKDITVEEFASIASRTDFDLMRDIRMNLSKSFSAFRGNPTDSELQDIEESDKTIFQNFYKNPKHHLKNVQIYKLSEHPLFPIDNCNIIAYKGHSGKTLPVIIDSSVITINTDQLYLINMDLLCPFRSNTMIDTFIVGISENQEDIIIAVDSTDEILKPLSSGLFGGGFILNLNRKIFAYDDLRNRYVKFDDHYAVHSITSLKGMIVFSAQNITGHRSSIRGVDNAIEAAYSTVVDRAKIFGIDVAESLFVLASPIISILFSITLISRLRNIDLIQLERISELWIILDCKDKFEHIVAFFVIMIPLPALCFSFGIYPYYFRLTLKYGNINMTKIFGLYNFIDIPYGIQFLSTYGIVLWFLFVIGIIISIISVIAMFRIWNSSRKIIKTKKYINH